jgi:outer membrane lipopolysaccharide assembly protein LptE/RlpB
MVLSPPLQHIYLQTDDPYGQLAHNLRLSLKMSGVQLAKTPESSTAILEILSETTSEQLLNISGTQTTRQYNLILTVTYQIRDHRGNLLTSVQTATETRPLTINANQMLSGSNQAVNLYQQMRQAIVYDIMSRLASRDISAILTIPPSTRP